jgi:glycosyltransferase involved in cell wall biosynthesis
MIKVSVVIKALNEEAHIAAAIESALMAVAPFGGEVILADSLSTDRTVEIAQAYPVKIVRLQNPGERCCGIGAQLGYQFSNGEYIYILDGDMRLRADFLSEALDRLEGEPNLAGVGGLVLEHSLSSLEYQARDFNDRVHLKPGTVDRLDGGGLYRRSAITAVGYLTNRNLHAYEEYELAVRLRAGGFLLYRLAMPSVDHYGHALPAHQLLMARWRSRYVHGIGELLRSAVGQPYLYMIIRELREIHVYFLVFASWLFLFGWLLFAPFDISFKLVCFTVTALGAIALMVHRKKSLVHALYAIIKWHVHLVAFFRGFFSNSVDPKELIHAEIIVSKARSF